MTSSTPSPSRTVHGCCYDTRNQDDLADLVAVGLIHVLAQPVAVRAAKLIASGTIPDPGNLPMVWANYVRSLQERAARG